MPENLNKAMASHATCKRAEIQYDEWLDDFYPIVEACTTPIIDLGCGSGNDTLYLIERKKRVIPCDISQRVIENIHDNFPEIERAECMDMAEGLPFTDQFTDLIIADLSLHYFPAQITRRIIAEIRRVLKPEGYLLFRVNSMQDVQYGAGCGVQLEHHFYEVEPNRRKRFFDQTDLQSFFADWEICAMQEKTMGRYGLPKQLFQCAVKLKK